MSASATSDAASAEGPLLWEVQTLPTACKGLLIDVIDGFLLQGETAASGSQC